MTRAERRELKRNWWRTWDGPGRDRGDAFCFLNSAALQRRCGKLWEARRRLHWAREASTNLPRLP